MRFFENYSSRCSWLWPALGVEGIRGRRVGVVVENRQNLRPGHRELLGDRRQSERHRSWSTNAHHLRRSIKAPPCLCNPLSTSGMINHLVLLTCPSKVPIHFCLHRHHHQHRICHPNPLPCVPVHLVFITQLINRHLKYQQTIVRRHRRRCWIRTDRLEPIPWGIAACRSAFQWLKEEFLWQLRPPHRHCCCQIVVCTREA